MIFDESDANPGLVRDPIIVGEIWPGISCGLYEVLDGGGTRIGWYVVTGSTNATSSTGFVWQRGQGYWFWDSSPFPANWRLRLYAHNNLPGWDPSTANLRNTAALLTGAPTLPAAGGSWWLVQRLSNGQQTKVGWLNRQPGNLFHWYGHTADALTLRGADHLVFTAKGDAPTTPMHRAIEAPV